MEREESPHHWPHAHFETVQPPFEAIAELGNLIQDRVESWHRPRRDEVDDSQPDLEEKRRARYWSSFERPLSDDLERVNYEWVAKWLELNMPTMAIEVQTRIEFLAARIPMPYSETTDTMIIAMADVAYFLCNLASKVRRSVDGEHASRERPDALKVESKSGMKAKKAKATGREPTKRGRPKGSGTTANRNEAWLAEFDRDDWEHNGGIAAFAKEKKVDRSTASKALNDARAAREFNSRPN